MARTAGLRLGWLAWSFASSFIQIACMSTAPERFESSLHERPPVLNAKGLKKKLDTELQRLAARPDEEIDLGDIPELDEAFFREAEWQPPIKKPITIRLDADVLEWFRSQGPGYQTRINRLLRRYMEVQQRRR